MSDERRQMQMYSFQECLRILDIDDLEVLQRWIKEDLDPTEQPVASRVSGAYYLRHHVAEKLARLHQCPFALSRLAEADHVRRHKQPVSFSICKQALGVDSETLWRWIKKDLEPGEQPATSPISGANYLHCDVVEKLAQLHHRREGLEMRLLEAQEERDAWNRDREKRVMAAALPLAQPETQASSLRERGKRSMMRSPLGRSPLAITALGFAGLPMDDESEAFALLDAYVMAGGNFIETEVGYSTSRCERVIGRWMKQRRNRDQLIIATKVGQPRELHQSALSRQHLFEDVQASLARLQTDVIDLYQAPQDDVATPLEEAMGAFDELVKQGKVRCIGAAHLTAQRLAQAQKVSQQHGYVGYESLQPRYSLVERQEFENGPQQFCIEQEIGIIAKFDFAHFLAMHLSSLSFDTKRSAVLRAVKLVTTRHNATPLQVVLAWLLAQPGITSVVSQAVFPSDFSGLIPGLELKLTNEDFEALTPTRQSHPERQLLRFQAS
jgi:aryl-alcohol dehydrogenase-like predicted oxidoreductase